MTHETKLTAYVKKPVTVHAIQYDGSPDSANVIYRMLNGSRTPAYKTECNLYIKTLEGDHTVSAGDFVIIGVKGEAYPCKPDIFELTYTVAP